MSILRIIDDAVIDRVFQPMVNRLRVSDVAHAAVPCYAFAAGAQIGRAVILHAQGLPSGHPAETAFGIVAACALYVEGLRNSRKATPRPNPIRHNPAFRFGRLSFLLLTLAHLGAVPFNQPFDVDTLLAWSCCALWAIGMYFYACESPPPRPKRRAVSSVTPNAA